LVYASASKGNRIGGGNPPFFRLPGCLAALEAAGLPENPGAYQSDYVWNYEVGSKNRLFNDRVHIEASGFFMDWKALQQMVYVPACSISFTANVGKATSDGFDLQITAQATNNLKLSLSIGYDNARIAETTGVPGGLVFVNKGDQIDPTQSPWIVASAIEYDYKIFSVQPSYARLDNEYHSKNPGPYTFANPDSTGYIAGQPVNGSQNITNLRVGTLTHGWDVAVYGKNLANSHPLLNATLDSQFAAIGHDYTLTPRTVGVTAAYRW
jgi:outer membrane receptor protein involved in Fe transport